MSIENTASCRARNSSDLWLSPSYGGIAEQPRWEHAAFRLQEIMKSLVHRKVDSISIYLYTYARGVCTHVRVSISALRAGKERRLRFQSLHARGFPLRTLSFLSLLSLSSYVSICLSLFCTVRILGKILHAYNYRMRMYTPPIYVEIFILLGVSFALTPSWSSSLFLRLLS